MVFFFRYKREGSKHKINTFLNKIHIISKQTVHNIYNNLCLVKRGMRLNRGEG